MSAGAHAPARPDADGTGAGRSAVLTFCWGLLVAAAGPADAVGGGVRDAAGVLGTGHALP